MTAQTVTHAVAVKDKADKLVTWLRAQQDEIAMAAASHIKPSTVVRIANGALRKDDKLMAAAIANPLSLLHCLLDAARLGHEPGTDQYYLMPFGQEVTGIEGYKGIIERMYRAGAVSAVVAEVVHQRDIYHRQGATQPPVHEFDEFADPSDRGPLRGAYAYAVMLDGRFSKIIPMGRAEIMKHKAMSRGSDRSDSPWQRWEESMWKKCPLRGLEPYVPTSSEWLIARAQAAAATNRPIQVTGFTPMPPVAGDGYANGYRPAEVTAAQDIHDAEIVEDTPPPRATLSEQAFRQEDANRAAMAGGPADPPAARAGKAAQAKLDGLLARLPLGPPEDVSMLLEWACGGPYTASRSHCQLVTSLLEDFLATAQGDVAEAAAAIWAQYRAATAQDAAEASQDEGETVPPA